MAEGTNVGSELADVTAHLRRAIEGLSADIADDPNDTDALVKRAVAYRALGEFDKALRDYDELVRLCPYDPTVYYSRGVTHLRHGDPSAAARDFAQASELDPWDVESRYGALAARMALGEHSKAIEDFEEFISQYPHYESAA